MRFGRSLCPSLLSNSFGFPGTFGRMYGVPKHLSGWTQGPGRSRWAQGLGGSGWTQDPGRSRWTQGPGKSGWASSPGRSGDLPQNPHLAGSLYQQASAEPTLPGQQPLPRKGYSCLEPVRGMLRVLPLLCQKLFPLKMFSLGQLPVTPGDKWHRILRLW